VQSQVGLSLVVPVEAPTVAAMALYPAHQCPPASVAPTPTRSFVLRLEDAASKRHAFVGVSFAERATAFDFLVAVRWVGRRVLAWPFRVF